MDKTYSAWHAVFAPAAYAVAGLMAVAGLYLLDPQVTDLGFDLRAEQTALAGVFLMYAALVLVLGTVRPRPSYGNAQADLLLSLVAGSIGLLIVGLMLTALGVQALFEEPRDDWVALLLAPGALAFVAMWFRDLEDAAEKAEAAVSEISADTGKAAEKAATFALLIFGVVYGVAMSVMLMWMALAFWLYYRLRAVLLEGATFAFGDVWADLSGLFIAVGPMIAFWAAFAAVMVVGIGLAVVAIQRLSRWGAKDADRDLSAAEIAFINDSAARIRSYALAQGYNKGVWRHKTFYFVSLIVMMIVPLAAFLMLRPAPDLGPSFPIVISAFGASAVVLVFAGIFLSVLPGTIMTRLSPRYAERSGWIGLGEKNEYFTVEGHLTSLVRSGRLSAAAPLDPARFLRGVNFAFEPYFLYPGVVLLAVSAFLVHRDLNAADTLTAAHIDVVDYWTLETTRYRYSDVARVTLVCFLSGKNEPVVYYELLFRDGRSLDIYTKDHEVRRKFDAYEAVDRMLRAAGVPFEAGVQRGLFNGGEPGYDPACVARLAGTYPGMQERVRALFRVDEGG